MKNIKYNIIAYFVFIRTIKPTDYIAIAIAFVGFNFAPPLAHK